MQRKTWQPVHTWQGSPVMEGVHQSRQESEEEERERERRGRDSCCLSVCLSVPTLEQVSPRMDGVYPTETRRRRNRRRDRDRQEREMFVCLSVCSS